MFHMYVYTRQQFLWKILCSYGDRDGGGEICIGHPRRLSGFEFVISCTFVEMKDMI